MKKQEYQDCLYNECTVCIRQSDCHKCGFYPPVREGRKALPLEMDENGMRRKVIRNGV